MNDIVFYALLATLGTWLVMWGSDKCVTYAQRRSALAQGEKNARLNRIILLVLSITLHNIPEGLAVGVAFGALKNGGYTPEALMGAVTVAVGIGLQNFPEGAAVSLPLRREGCSRRKSFSSGRLPALWSQLREFWALCLPCTLKPFYRLRCPLRRAR